MVTFLWIRYFHFIGIFSVVAVLFFEWMMIRPVLSRSEIARLARLDALYGVGALVTLIAGLLMWLVVGKPATFYSTNWIFYTKIGLFTVVGLLSIGPTVFFIKNRKGEEAELVAVPQVIRLMIRLEMLFILIIPLLAVWMAQGYGQR